MADPSPDKYGIPCSTKTGPKKLINILLMGETGVGKSTFINSFVNYLSFETLEEATDKLLCLIPTSFTIRDKNSISREVKYGDNATEYALNAQSDTQSSNSYKVDLKNQYIINLIDTPGIGDTKGTERDKQNLDDILVMISHFKELHAICFFLKPNDSRITSNFEYCMTQMLCYLEKSASKNIVFIFTNSCGSKFKPGDTTIPLTKILDKIKSTPPYVEITYDNSTWFCFDNETFRYMTATKQGIKFTEEDIEDYNRSWKKSQSETFRLIKYIIGTDTQQGLAPHKVMNTVCVNEARRMILALTRPLADTIQINKENKRIAERHKENLENDSGKVKTLKEKLYEPFVDMEIKEIDEPIAVCSSPQCCEEYTVWGLKKFHYTTVCHKPCHCLFSGLWRYTCKGINFDGYCKTCGCPSSKHLHIYYESKTVEKSILNETVHQSIEQSERSIKSTERIIRDLDDRIKKIDEELDFITETTAKFAFYLKNNSIMPYNDSFERYLKQLIETAKVSSDNENNIQVLIGLEEMLDNYKDEITRLDKHLEKTTDQHIITTEDVFKYIDKLKRLELNGFKIKIAHDTQLRCVSSSYLSSNFASSMVSAFSMLYTGVNSVMNLNVSDFIAIGNNFLQLKDLLPYMPDVE